MDVAIAGSSGFIGRAVSRALSDAGHRVRPLLRPANPPHPDGIRWDPAGGWVDADAFDGLDAVVNVAGESIGTARWTPKRKAALRDSRVSATRTLAAAIAAAKRPPRVFVSASASGVYGDRGDDVLDESSPYGDGFLAGVCRDWEAAAAGADVRTVLLRSGLVLHPSGGLLKRMLLPFRLGLGARLGDGRQWMPWITLDDEASAIRHLLERDDASGPFNLCTPNPVRNAEFTRALARALRRPAFVAIPRPALRLLFGEDATRDALCVSARMTPTALEASGFAFESPVLADALRPLLSRGR